MVQMQRAKYCHRHRRCQCLYVRTCLLREHDRNGTHLLNSGLMTSSFGFVPRNVSRALKVQHSSSNGRQIESGPSTFVSNSTATELPVDRKLVLRTASKTANPLKSLSNEHYAILICLALSDHSVWSDPDLRFTIEQHTEHCMYYSSTLLLRDL